MRRDGWRLARVARYLLADAGRRKDQLSAGRKALDDYLQSVARTRSKVEKQTLMKYSVADRDVDIATGTYPMIPAYCGPMFKRSPALRPINTIATVSIGSVKRARQRYWPERIEFNNPPLSHQDKRPDAENRDLLRF